jgi:hypothetical protein
MLAGLEAQPGYCLALMGLGIIADLPARGVVCVPAVNSAEQRAAIAGAVKEGVKTVDFVFQASSYL